MNIETLEDVQVFIDTLVATDMLWHAEDLVSEVPNFAKLSNPKKLQEMMNKALYICEQHDVSIFECYPAE